MIQTTTKTKTAVAVILAGISIASMLAGLYYYGSRVLKNGPVSVETLSTASTTNIPHSGVSPAQITDYPSGMSAEAFAKISLPCHEYRRGSVKITSLSPSSGSWARYL